MTIALTHKFNRRKFPFYKSALTAIYLNTPQSRKLLSSIDQERFEAMAMVEISNVDRSILWMAVAHARKNLTLIGCLTGNAAYWFLSAGVQQVIILNACCLLILILQRRSARPEEASRNRAGQVLMIYSLHVVIACDIVSVLIDQASPASLY